MMSTLTVKAKNSRLLLHIATVAVAILWVLTQPITFNSDSATFLQYANWLSGKAEISPFWYLRTPGFPILLIISGVTKFSSFTYFMLLQAILSCAIVYCIYNIIKLLQPKYALIITWLSIFTCVPFVFSTMVSSEHANIFGYLWLVYCLIAFTNKQHRKYLYYAALANIFIFLLKPSNYWVIICSTTYLALFNKQEKIKSLVKFLGIYCAIAILYVTGFGLLKLAHPGLEGMSTVFQGSRAVVYQVYQEQLFKEKFGNANSKLITALKKYYPNKALRILEETNGEHYNQLTQALTKNYPKNIANKILLTAAFESYYANPATFFRWLKSIFSSSNNNYTGQMLFYPLMLKAPYFTNDETGMPNSKIASTNGSATAQLLHHLKNYIIKREYVWREWNPKEAFANFAGHPEALLENIFQNPTHTYHAFIWQALDREIGPTEASKLFLAAALEGFKKYPQASLYFLDDLVSYFFGLDATYKSGSRVMFMPGPGLGEIANSPYLSDIMMKQMQQPIIKLNKNFWNSLYQFYSYIWLLTKILFFVMAIIGVIIMFNNKLLPVFLLIWSLIMYNALITCVFADPFFRYSALTWLLTTIVALQTICYLIEKKALVFNNKTLTPTIAIESS